MKKYLTIMMCAGLLLTATGCGDEEKEDDSSKKENTKVEEKAKNKVLSCSMSYEDQMSVDATFVYDLEGKKISKASMNYSIKVDEDELEYVADKDTDELCEEFDDSEAVKKCNAKLDGNKVVANLEYDVDKLDEDEDDFTKDTPIDELKKIMEGDEDDEFAPTCKIEEK